MLPPTPQHRIHTWMLLLKDKAVLIQGRKQQHNRMQWKRGGLGKGFFKRILNQGLIVSK